MQKIKDLKQDVRDFLDKLGIELPEPRTMEGFGTELPLPYLERCLEIIIPAVESHFDDCQEEVLKDFLQHVHSYKGFHGVTFMDRVSAKTGKNNAKRNGKPFNLDKTSQRIFEYFEAHPGNVRAQASADLGISMSVLDRRLRQMIRHGIEVKNNRLGTGAFKGDIEDVKQFFKENPDATQHECAIALGISDSVISRRMQTIKANGGLPAKESTEALDDAPEETVVTEAVPEENNGVTGEDVAAETETETVAPSAPVYQEGGYMADVRARFENRNKEEVTDITVTAVENGPKEDYRGLIKAPSFSLRSFSLLKHFNSLSAEEQEKAVAEHWDTDPADILATEGLNKRFTSIGIKLRRRELTRMEFAMLSSVLADKSLSYLDKIRRYSDYLVKA